MFGLKTFCLFSFSSFRFNYLIVIILIEVKQLYRTFITIHPLLMNYNTVNVLIGKMKIKIVYYRRDAEKLFIQALPYSLYIFL